ncbi:PH domain-containing protein [Nakamurella flavida]|uniref:PH domain-containing protein n=1 Tax=Nakamurella flavida TaxID=363630 RepID=A0A938YPM4_9ACTN|nr:PH domain-containing protein [Nakamurella flavida]MBM9477064.1 PH domain-containing protein [Nakamurella flavida]MDP9780010.1 hypothetical protein [Nakamurella flavida]
MSRPGPGNTPGASAADTPLGSTPRSPRRVTLRLPAWALLLPVVAFLCAIPLVTAGGVAGGLFVWLGYGIPALVLVSTLLTRTTADARRIAVIGPWRRRTIAWAELDSLEFTGTRWAVAVTAGGKRIRLIMVRPRDLPALTAVAGGELLLAEDQETGDDETGEHGTGEHGTGEPGTGDGESGDHGTGDHGTAADPVASSVTDARPITTAADLDAGRTDTSAADEPRVEHPDGAGPGPGPGRA